MRARIRFAYCFAVCISLTTAYAQPFVTTVFHTATSPPVLPEGYTVAHQVSLPSVTLMEAHPTTRDVHNSIIQMGVVSDTETRLLLNLDEAFTHLSSERAVLSASLSLYHIGIHGGTGALPWHMSFVTTEWDATEATWHDAASGSPWHTPGGDIDTVGAISGQVLCEVEGRHVFDCTDLFVRYMAGEDRNSIAVYPHDTAERGALYISAYNGESDVLQQPYIIVITTDDDPYGEPFVDITNHSAVVGYHVTHYSIGGTNNTNVTGGMSWHNSLTGDSGVFAASQSWTIEDIALGLGANVITVTGTNASGATAHDNVTIVRANTDPAIILNITPADGTGWRANGLMYITVQNAHSVLVNGSQAQLQPDGRYGYFVQISTLPKSFEVVAVGVGGNDTNTVSYVYNPSGPWPPVDPDPAVILAITPPDGTAWHDDGLMYITVQGADGGVMVNGSPAQIQPDGRYSYYVHTSLLPASYEVVAFGSGGNDSQTVNYSYDPSGPWPPLDPDPAVITEIIPADGTGWHADGMMYITVQNADGGVMVNGTSAQVQPDGRYGYYVQISTLPQTYEVIAIGSGGNDTNNVSYVYDPSGPWPPVDPDSAVIIDITPADGTGWRADGLMFITVQNAHGGVHVNGVSAHIQPDGRYGYFVRTSLLPRTYQVVAIGNGGNDTNTVSYVYDPSGPWPPTPVPSITIANPQVEVTDAADVLFNGMYSLNGGVLDTLVADIDGAIVPVTLATDNMWSADTVTLGDGPNVLRAVITLQNGNAATATWTIVRADDPTTRDAVPAITIANPQSTLTHAPDVLFNGTYALNEGVLGSITATLNGNPVPLYPPIDGIWNAGIITLANGINTLEAIITLNNGNAATATWVIIHQTDPTTRDAVPAIAIEMPSTTVTDMSEVLFNGTYALNDGVLGTLSAEVNDAPVFLSPPVEGVWNAHSIALQEGLNVLRAIITLNNGNAATATWHITRIVAPSITITRPNYSATDAVMVRFDGTYALNGGVFNTLNAFVNGVAVVPAPTVENGLWDAGVVSLETGITNEFKAVITLMNGHAATAEWTVVHTVAPIQPENLRIELDPSDASRVILRWNGPTHATILAQTDQYYDPSGPWHVLAANVTSPWTDTTVGGRWARYYRVLDRTKTNAYDVGVYAVSIDTSAATRQTPVQAWISTPFWHNDMTESVPLMEALGGQLTAYGLADAYGIRQQRDFGDIVTAESRFRLVNGVPSWSGNDFRTNFFYRKGHVLVIRTARAEPLTLRFTGIVPTQAVSVDIARTAGSIAWIGSYYPVVRHMDDGGLAPHFLTARPLSIADGVRQQAQLGSSSTAETRYRLSGGVPSWTGTDFRTFLWPGKMHMLIFREDHGVGTWTITAPYLDE